MRLSLALPLLAALAAPRLALAQGVAPPTGGAGPEHDFDYFFGSWTVQHRRLKVRFAKSNDWETYEGATTCIPLLGGIANLNDSITHRDGKSYRTLGLRAYDAKAGTWADWSLDGRDPSQIDPPGVGRFVNGVGQFVTDETIDGQPLKVRGQFSSLSPKVAQWDQAFSADSGKTWETNYVMRYTRTS